MDRHLEHYELQVLQHRPPPLLADQRRIGGMCGGETREKLKIEPETYKILDGRLYLFYNFLGNNTFQLWEHVKKNLKISTDQPWEKSISRIARVINSPWKFRICPIFEPL